MQTKDISRMCNIIRTVVLLSTMGDFTFWISLSMSLFAQSKD